MIRWFFYVLCFALVLAGACTAQTSQPMTDELGGLRDRWHACVNKSYFSQRGITVDQAADAALLSCQREEDAMAAFLTRYGFPNVASMMVDVRTGKTTELLRRTRRVNEPKK
jgi:hypothetical protein